MQQTAAAAVVGATSPSSSTPTSFPPFLHPLPLHAFPHGLPPHAGLSALHLHAVVGASASGLSTSSAVGGGGASGGVVVGGGGGGGVVAAAGAQMVLLRQTSPTQERVSRNGLQKHVHVVVKNTPFLLQLALTGPVFTGSGSVVDFKTMVLDVALLYDSDSMKAVSFVKTKPLDFKPMVNERGDQVSLNTKIKVLTSQHEDMFFRVRVRALEPKTKHEFLPPIEVVSGPIKVISKPKQAKKRAPTKKRSVNDLLIETVLRVEEQQKLQKKKLKGLLDKRVAHLVPEQSPGAGDLFPTTPKFKDEPQDCSSTTSAGATDFWGPSTSSSSSSSSSSASSAPSSSSTSTSSSSSGEAGLLPLEADEFTLALHQLLSAYAHLQPEDKPAKIRRIMRTHSNHDTEQLGELLDSLVSTRSCGSGDESKEHKKDDAPTVPASGCACLVCPYQQELARIDEFYKDFLAADANGLGREFSGLVQQLG